MNPIQHLVALAGEDATIHFPATAPNYDPGASGDYQPPAPTDLPVRGVPEKKIELATGASGAFTAQMSSIPGGLGEGGLVAEGTTLTWRGQTWTVVSWRHRTWLGKTNGATLFLSI